MKRKTHKKAPARGRRQEVRRVVRRIRPSKEPLGLGSDDFTIAGFYEEREVALPPVIYL